MNILGIDTSSGTSVAVLHDGTVLAEWRDDRPRAHAEVIGELIATVLDDAGNPHIDLVATGTGPGPFTGLRVGVAAAIAFAAGRGAPVVGVLSHDAIARDAYLDGGALPDGPVAVVTDAKRREVFVTRYRGLDGARLPLRDGETATATPDELPSDERAWTGPASAGGIAAIASSRARAGLPQQPAVPVYVREPDVSQAKHKTVLQ